MGCKYNNTLRRALGVGCCLYDAQSSTCKTGEDYCGQYRANEGKFHGDIRLQLLEKSLNEN